MGGWWRWALVSPDGVAPNQMVGVSASVNRTLHHKVQKFSSGTGSPGWSRKKGRKMVVCVCGGSGLEGTQRWRWFDQVLYSVGDQVELDIWHQMSEGDVVVEMAIKRMWKLCSVLRWCAGPQRYRRKFKGVGGAVEPGRMCACIIDTRAACVLIALLGCGSAWSPTARLRCAGAAKSLAAGWVCSRFLPHSKQTLRIHVSDSSPTHYVTILLVFLRQLMPGCFFSNLYCYSAFLATTAILLFVLIKGKLLVSNAADDSCLCCIRRLCFFLFSVGLFVCLSLLDFVGDLEPLRKSIYIAVHYKYQYVPPLPLFQAVLFQNKWRSPVVEWFSCSAE